VWDLHTHPAMKSQLFHRNLGGGKKRFLATLKEASFWPFSERITFPKLEEGGVDVMLSTAYVLEQGWIDDIKLIKFLFWLFPSVRKLIVDPTYFDATNMMLDQMESQVESYSDSHSPDSKSVKMAGSVSELEANLDEGITSIIHSIEGAHSLQHVEAGRTLDETIMSSPEDIEKELLANVEHFFNRGVAYLTLAHFYPNQVVSPVFPYPEYGLKHLKWKQVLGRWDMNEGLTASGRSVVEKMLELGMLIDISHCTPTAKQQIFDIVDHHGKTSCLLATHVGAFGVNPDMYNLEDHEIRWLANHGCVAGVIFMNYWLSPVDSNMGLKYIDQTLRHMVDVGGEDVVALGTDFDGFTDPPDEITNISELPRFTKYMCATNYYSNELMEKILGGNAFRVFKEGWGKK
jgi:membrane dipeptidase